MGSATGKRLFLSWAHTDRAAKDALVGPLTDNLRILRGVRFTWWEDSHLLIGDQWRRALLARLAACDYGVLLLSPAFFASDFIRAHELPRFVGEGADKGALPVGLERFPLDGSRELHGVDRHQIFTAPGSGKFFTQTRGHAGRQFAQDLATAIRNRVVADR